MYAMQNQENAVVFQEGNKRLRVSFVNAAIARITCTERRAFSDASSQIVIAPANFTGFEARERNNDFLITTAELQIEISKPTGAICYRDAQGRLLLQEPARGGRWLTKKKSTGMFISPKPEWLRAAT
jgi:alpha-D-xyloside xylohydrolase